MGQILTVHVLNRARSASQIWEQNHNRKTCLLSIFNCLRGLFRIYSFFVHSTVRSYKVLIELVIVVRIYEYL